MKRKIGRAFRTIAVSFLIVCCITCSSLDRPASTASARTGDEGRLAEIEAQVAAAQKERQAIQSNVTNLKALKANLQQSKKNLDAYVEQLDASLNAIKSNIESLTEQIEEKKQQIEKTQKELDIAIENQEAQYAAMKNRIRFMFEKGDRLIAEAFVGSETFSDMLNKAQYIEKIAEYDRNKLNEYIDIVKTVQLTKQALEEEQKTLDEAVEAQKTEEENVQVIMVDKAAEIYGISQDISDQEAKIKAAQATMADMDAQIAKLVREAESIKNPSKYDGGMFTWPCPGYRYISGEFMESRTGYSHKGVDMAASTGTAILAAYGGVVTSCANNGGWIM